MHYHAAAKFLTEIPNSAFSRKDVIVRIYGSCETLNPGAELLPRGMRN